MTKVAICGVHGAGKSTLFEKMRAEMPKIGRVCVVSEVARGCPHPLRTVKAQQWIWHVHYMSEIEATASGCNTIICDRTLMDNLVYFRHLLDHHPSEHGEDSFKFFYVATQVWMKTYDQIIRLPLNEEWITSANDDMRPKDLGYAREIDALFDTMLGDYVTEAR